MRVLLNTVGTSILIHRKNEGRALSEETHRWIVGSLSQLPREDRRLGAELNSIHSIERQGEIVPGDLLYFLVSDTREGRFVGELLREITDGWGYRTTPPQVVKNLRGDDPHAFEAGLRTLVRSIAQIYREHAKARGEPVLLNATGGYKAQISFAGLIGQVFGVPVFYQFETFPQAIKLPPLPIAFDLDDWLAYQHVLKALDEGENGTFLSANDPRLKELPEKLHVLLDHSQGLVALGALGQLYHEGFRERFAASREMLVPCDSGIPLERKARNIRYEDKNHGKHRGLNEYFQRILRKAYVTRIQTVRYVPEKPAHGRFRPDPAYPDRLKGSYWDGTVAVEFFVYLSEQDVRKAQAAAADLADETI